MKLSLKCQLPALVTISALWTSGPVCADQSPNGAKALLRQCEAMLSGEAEVEARMTCENTIWSSLQTIEAIEKQDLGTKPIYCAPQKISVVDGARLYVRFVNANPALLDLPAEHVLIQALKAAYPCTP